MIEVREAKTAPPIMKREDVLQYAKTCVCGEREADYGSPEDNFAIIASFWTTYLGHEVTPVDVAAMMALLKIARVSGSAGGVGTQDCWVDLAGYAACGGELAELEKA